MDVFVVLLESCAHLLQLLVCREMFGWVQRGLLLFLPPAFYMVVVKAARGVHRKAAVFSTLQSEEVNGIENQATSICSCTD